MVSNGVKLYYKNKGLHNNCIAIIRCIEYNVHDKNLVTIERWTQGRKLHQKQEVAVLSGVVERLTFVL